MNVYWIPPVSPVIAFCVSFASAVTEPPFGLALMVYPVMALLPGIPLIPFMLLGVGASALAYTIEKRTKAEATAVADKAEAEVQPIKSLAAELALLHSAGPNTLGAYLRNVRLALYEKAQQVYLEVSR